MSPWTVSLLVLPDLTTVRRRTPRVSPPALSDPTCPCSTAATNMRSSSGPPGRLSGADLPLRAMAPPAGRPAAAKRRTASSSASGATSDSTWWTQDFNGGTSRLVAGRRTQRSRATPAPPSAPSPANAAESRAGCTAAPSGPAAPLARPTRVAPPLRRVPAAARRRARHAAHPFATVRFRRRNATRQHPLGPRRLHLHATTVPSMPRVDDLAADR